MWRQRSKAWIWLLLPVVAAIFYLTSSLLFYRGSYSPPSVTGKPIEQFSLPSYPSNRSTDVPVARDGVFVLDKAHLNGFDDEELDTLVSKVAARGYTVEFMTGFSRKAALKDHLRRADSFAVILPGAYTSEEADLVETFVDKGGRLLLIADPSRSHEINSLADRFGIHFQDGYLYNVLEHDLNYRNILVRSFRPDDITSGLGAIALYTAGSVKSTGPKLAFTDTNTLSSMVQRVEPFAPVARSADGRVLAISDLTFMLPPQNTTLDNDQFISNIANFLTTGQREFDLADFPHFFRGDVDIIVTDASLFEASARLKSDLSEEQVTSEVRGVEDLGRDTIFLTLFQDTLEVAQYLDAAGVRVDESIRTPFTPDIDPEGAALLLLHQGNDRRVLIIVGESPGTVNLVLVLLRRGDFKTGLVSDLLGIYRAS